MPIEEKNTIFFNLVSILKHELCMQFMITSKSDLKTLQFSVCIYLKCLISSHNFVLSQDNWMFSVKQTEIRNKVKNNYFYLFQQRFIISS